MAAAGVDARGLTTEELDGIRDAVAAGRKPRVQFTESAGQIAGQVGQVVGLEDPAVSEEWVVVKFGRDELPFSPVDLRIAPKGAPAKKVVVVPEPEPEPVLSGPEFLIDKPIEKPRPAPVQRKSEDDVDDKDVQEAAAPAPRKAVRPVKAKPAPALTVTLTYTDGEWTVGANQGAKALAKPYVIRPAEALKMVQLIDVPGVQEAVEQILSGERAEAEQQAQRLRAELAEIEARLAELGEAGSQPS